MNNEEYILYILMRTDLPSMNPGKAMAQASHASNQFIKESKQRFDTLSVTEGAVNQDEWELLENVTTWQNESNGFGTVLVLGCTQSDMDRLNIQYDKGFSSYVVDITYPYIVNSEILSLISSLTHTSPPIKIENKDLYICFRRETTCMYVFGKKSDLSPYLEHLSLHP